MRLINPSKTSFYTPSFFWLASVVFFLFLAFWAIVSKGAWGGMDSYEHYLISRYSWQHPTLFLDNWGKPLFTLSHSIFAQFGFTFFKVVNVFWILVIAVILKSMLQKVSPKVIPFIPLLLFTSPMVMKNSVSGLTEPFTAILVLVTLSLFIKKQWTVGAIFAGFLPYVRSEGYLIALVIGLFLIYQKQFRSFFCLVIGSLFFNTLGGIITGDWLWIYNSNPYIEAQVYNKGACGSGSLFHYLIESEFIFGWLFLLLLPLAIGTAFRKKNLNRIEMKILVLFVCIFLFYFGVHSFIWWRGLMGSCGYTRVMIVIFPIAIFLLLYMLAPMIEKKGKIFPISYIIAAIIAFAIFFDLGKKTFPLDIDNEQKEMIKVAEWLKENTTDEDLLYFQFPYLNVVGNINPFDDKRHRKLFHFGFKHAPLGSVIIWDAHFGPNDCHIPLDYLKKSEDLEEMMHIVPDQSFKTMNNYDFEVYIFKRVRENDKRDKPNAY